MNRPANASTALLCRHLTKNDVPTITPGGPKIHSRWLSYESLQQNGLDDDDDDDDDETLLEVEEANMRCKGSLEVRKTEGQWGVHPTRPYNEGDIVISSNLKHNDTKSTLIPCAHSIQIGWGKHILMNLPARYINHSCDPNIGVGGLNECGSYDFVALRDIESDEELKFDYETTEYEIGAFSECLCGSQNCRGSIHVSVNDFFTSQF